MNTNRAHPMGHRLASALRRALIPATADDRGSFMTEYPVGTALIVAAGIGAIALITNGLEGTANFIVGMLPGSG